MNLYLDRKLAYKYTSQSQKIRVLTEQWVGDEIFCPNCGHRDISKYKNGQPVADFFCSKCKEDYELKSKKSEFGSKIVDGAYSTMIKWLTSSNNPNFFLLKYDLTNFEVINFLVIPKHFFVPSVIEKRKPLAPTADRHGWVGCNIILQGIPQSGKIFFIKNKIVEPKNNVLAQWQKTLFLREQKELSTKGWLLDVMNYIERFRGREFSLNEIYVFENELGKKHPNNRHIQDKIRQQLQFLRDGNYLEFISRGRYSLK